MTGSTLRSRRRAGLVVSVVVLAGLVLASLNLGARSIPLSVTLDAILDLDRTNDLHLIVVELRVPRTMLAILVGMCLGLAGAVMQALTRNPLAEPGLLGVNAGAAAAIVTGIAITGSASITGYVWFGFLGAGLGSAAVYTLGRAHDAGTNPVRLVLAGAGISVVLAAFTNIMIANSQDTIFVAFRSWATGSLQGRGYDVVPVVALATAVGTVLALSIAGSLNSIALGRDLSAALGLATRRTWLTASMSVLLLAGAATAAAGPVVFVGLAAPHIARLVVGPDYRWVLPYSLLFATIMLLTADVLGRVVAPPSEIGAGVMSALIGGPFFVMLVRRRKIAQL